MDSHDQLDRKRANYTVLGSVISLALTFVAQLVVVVWFGGTYTAATTTKLDNVLDQVKSLNTNIYTREEARRDIQRLDAADTDIHRRLDRLEAKPGK